MSSSIIPPTYTPVSQTPGLETAAPTPAPQQQYHHQQQQQQPLAGASPSFVGEGSSPLAVPNFGQESQHGSFYFSHLSFTGTFARTFRLFFDHWRVFIPIATVVLVPLVIISVLTTIWVVERIMEMRNEGYHPKHLHMLFFMMFIQLLLYGIITVWGRGAMIRAVAEIYSGKIPTGTMWKDCMRHIWVAGQLKPLIISSVMIVGGLIVVGLVPYLLLVLSEWAQDPITGLLAILSILAYVVGCMYVYSLCILVSPVICIENNLRPISALYRSKEIVTGTHCYVYLSLLLLWVMNHVATNIAHAIFLGDRHDGSARGAAMVVLTSFEGILVSMVPLLIFFPLHSIIEVVMYINIRVQRESLDRDTFVRELEEQDRLPTSDISSRYSAGTTLNMEGMWKSIAGAGGMSVTEPSTDYRQVPLMDGEEGYPPQQQQIV